MLCDSHLHYIPKEISDNTVFYKGPWADKDRLFSFLENNNIDKALLVYPSTDAHLKLGNKSACEIYNNAIEKIIKENSKIIGAAVIDIDSLGNVEGDLTLLKDKGFKAISISSSYNGKFLVKELFGLFEAASKKEMPIFVHPQTINPIGLERVKDPLLMPVLEYSFDSSMFMGLLMMEEVLEKFDTKFIFSSLGGVMPFLKDRFDRVYQMLRSRDIVKDLGRNPSQILKKVYVEASGASLKNVELAMEMFEEDHILWGSDYPVNSDVVQSISMLESFGETVKEKITSKNFCSIFGGKL